MSIRAQDYGGIPRQVPAVMGAVQRSSLFGRHEHLLGGLQNSGSGEQLQTGFHFLSCWIFLEQWLRYFVHVKLRQL